MISNTVCYNVTGDMLGLSEMVTQKKYEQREYTSVEKEANRDNDLQTLIEQEAALDQLGLRKLFFIGWVGSLRLSCP